MKRLASTLRLILRNWKAFLGFETLFKLFTATVFIPLLFAVFSLTIRSAGLPYLSTDAIQAYLLNPVTIVCLLLMLLLTAFISLWDMQAVICCCHASQQNRNVTMSEMALAGLRNASKIFRPRNWLMIVFVVLIVPFTNAAAISGLIAKIELPEFIEDFIRANTVLHLIWVCVSVFLTLLAVRWCFSLHAFALEGKSFGAACRESARLTKKHALSIAFGTAAVGLLVELLLFLLGCIFAGIAFLGVRFLCPPGAQFSVASAALFAALTIGSYLSAALAVPVAFAYLSVRYYAYNTDLQACADMDRAVADPHSKRSARRVTALLCAGILCGATLQIAFSYDIQDTAGAALRQPEIVAHRGSSVNAPENSIPAFRKAIADGADWIELDVHQTKDGVVVVTHDESLKRIAGVNRNVWELTYDELMQYDVGAWFSPAYAGLRVATLDEALKLCKGKIKLNIELKPTGHEPDFERHVLDVVRENGYGEGEYILASLNVDTLKTIKRLEPDEKTLYIMTIAVGNVQNIPFADAFSVEESSVTQRLVSSVHAAGKQLYAWTVNHADNVEKMADLHVDGVISDDPLMAKAALAAAPLSDDLQSIVALFFPEDASLADADTENRTAQSAAFHAALSRE